ncbi:MAG TPA: YggS family pyridoxal phosphate-dependent enzyme [Anaerolineales bacterium]|nr:YggS family pyridoxal phosphate-dependent enzyme [Anaerolineales bacterium]HNO32475.1 YggS family pyridoxal phosphate-dependent enzyme [Anaerolineales bacterium]
MSELVQSIRERYLATLEKIASAAKKAGRSPEAVKLVVVTKAQPVEVARAAIEAGAQVLGENYAEEGVMKLQQLAEFSAVEWHMIGHVQSRKAPLVAANFNFVHSLDSLKLAKRLDKFSAEAGRTLPVMLEFNVGGEDSKSGWNAADESRWPALMSEIAETLALPNLKVRGLMSMPPLGSTPDFSRPYFQKLMRLREYLINRFPAADFTEVSMGTSSDYEVAVEEGATFVRVGTAIVGPRTYKTENE